MGRYELHHSNSVIRSESIQELYQLSLYTESDWQLYKIVESSMNSDMIISGKYFTKDEIEKIKKEISKGCGREYFKQKYQISAATYNSLKASIKR